MRSVEGLSTVACGNRTRMLLDAGFLSNRIRFGARPVVNGIEPIALPLEHPGAVNAWLLRGEPLTLVDTGPASEAALHALEHGLAAHGVALEDLELVLATHHHMDHVGLVATIQRRSSARVAVLDRVADYGASYHERVAV